ncbi:zinc finger protein 664 isoform X3 [Bos indicus x Bos taurus]|uniref:uncharacterized protein n=1 Tax=Bos taurus TaxID=9913 RepID=UPI000383E287|nr:uncharacterized protein LOC101904642 [Bos taurus]XP_027422814.1 zinc finger protein 664 isoform X3 [Bos indicus x Bos taurus]
MSGLKKRKTTHHLGWAWSRGERPGIGWERSEWLRAAWRPGGHPGRPGGGQPDFGPRRAGVGPQCRGAGVTDGGQGARRRRGSDRGEAGRRPQGSQTPEPGSIVVGAEGRGSKTALETREAAPWSLSRRVPGEASASRPSRASGASYSGDEEPSGHPAQIAAAAGRLHCLTITRAGFSPRILRLLLPFSHCGPCLFLWNVLGVLTSVTVTCKSKRPISGRESSFLKITEGDCQSNSRAGRLTRRTDTPGPAVLASGEAPV